MNYGNCGVCGKQVAYRGVRICAECKEMEFKRIKEYLNENGKTRINVIAQDLKLPKKLLFEYVIDGRLDASDIGKDDYDNAVDTERRANLASFLGAYAQQNTPAPKKEIDRESPKMRFLSRGK